MADGRPEAGLSSLPDPQGLGFEPWGHFPAGRRGALVSVTLCSGSGTLYRVHQGPAQESDSQSKNSSLWSVKNKPSA